MRERESGCGISAGLGGRELVAAAATAAAQVVVVLSKSSSTAQA